MRCDGARSRPLRRIGGRRAGRRRVDLRCPGRNWVGERGEQGSSLVEVSMVIVLLIGLLLAVLQVGALFYVRSVVAASATAGARWAANPDLTPGEGGGRASRQIASALSPSIAASIPCTGSSAVDAASGLELVVVRCTGTIRSIFLPIGALVTVDVRSRALREIRP
ncbi:MAG: pilus assembly protein [Frankiaceae bacterium]|jgi:Flp pilus assembly protein TadG|nr:pilus assembly protein [Frankiaceae bacterium]